MRVNILTSGFTNGFPREFAELLNEYLIKRSNFVFIASEFNNCHERTDMYCNMFLKMFEECGISFENIYVIDSCIPKKKAQQIVKQADVLWLSGGDTPTEFMYIKSYGLIPIIQEREGVTIGMSAGSINMAQTAICTETCEHDRLEIYEALGLVEMSVEPHLNKKKISDELIGISKEYRIYGMCDNSVIISDENKTTYIGDIFLIEKGKVKQLSFSR